MNWRRQSNESRFEFRYLVHEREAERIRDFVTAYLTPDELCVGQPDGSYSVHTLYLDSDDWRILWNTVRVDEQRFKLRLRFYRTEPGDPVFCEVKRQAEDRTLKHRSGVKLEAVPALLAGFIPGSEAMWSENPAAMPAVQRFVDTMLKWNARPKLHLAWRREAYSSEDGAVRVTMDRHVCAAEHLAELPTTAMANPLVCTRSLVILELRFAERFPDWYRELVEIFNLGHRGSWTFEEGSLTCAGRRFSAREVVETCVL